MPSPVVLKVELAPAAAAATPSRSSDSDPASGFVRSTDWLNANSAIVTYPVDVWFAGSRTFVAGLEFPGRTITRITLDPFGRFPDRNPRDNVWPSAQATPKPGGGN